MAGDALDAATLTPRLRDNPKSGNVSLALAVAAGVTALDIYCGQSLSREDANPHLPLRDYRDRSGLPRAPHQMRGAAADFVVPRDMRTPEAMRPYTTH